MPSVTGAPGDGSTSLTAAIQRELSSKGVPSPTRPTAGAYRVEGTVTVGQAKDGKQPIQIEWMVRDPQGKKLGTVSQKQRDPGGLARRRLGPDRRAGRGRGRAGHHQAAAAAQGRQLTPTRPAAPHG